MQHVHEASQKFLSIVLLPIAPTIIADASLLHKSASRCIASMKLILLLSAISRAVPPHRPFGIMQACALMRLVDMQHHELIIPAFATQSQKVDIVMVVKARIESADV